MNEVNPKRPRRGGIKTGTKIQRSPDWKPKPYEERSVQVCANVQRKYYHIASKAVKELCKQWRSKK